MILSAASLPPARRCPTEQALSGAHAALPAQADAVQDLWRVADAGVCALDLLPGLDLQRVLCDLLESEISAGVQTLPFDTFRVWIGDDLNGVAAEARFEDEKIWKDAGAIAHWLQSDYARRWRR